MLMLCLLLVSCSWSPAAGFSTDEYVRLIFKLSMNATIQADFESHVENMLDTDANYYHTLRDNKFPCDVNGTVSNSTPSTVHTLRPGDIRVVGAVGDSLTAALGARARTVVGLLEEFRGNSWSMGGDESFETYVTLPNILRKFNPDLLGYSQGSDLIPVGDYLLGIGLNAAISGSEVSDIPAQMDQLVKRLRKWPGLDYDNDWKLVNVFIGGNDLCNIDADDFADTPDAYAGFLRIALDQLYAEVPRVFVNLISVVNVSMIRDFDRPITCDAVQTFTCRCGAFPRGNETETIDEFVRAYHNLTEALAASERYQGRDDFAVVWQPFLKDFHIPKLPNGRGDLSYMAPDCFHLSVKGHGKLSLRYEFVLLLLLLLSCFVLYTIYCLLYDD